jgi:hypothetical protein
VTLWRPVEAPKSPGMEFRWTCPELSKLLDQALAGNDDDRAELDVMVFRLAGRDNRTGAEALGSGA